MFRLAIYKDAIVADGLNYLRNPNVNLAIAANEFWRRSLRPVEVVDLYSLISLTDPITLSSAIDDVLVWVPSNSTFTVSSFTDIVTSLI